MSITGTPTAAGVFTFTVQVADSAAALDTQLFNVTVTSSSSGGTIGGGGGGGGGCSAHANNAPWFALAALAILLVQSAGVVPRKLKCKAKDARETGRLSFSRLQTSRLSRRVRCAGPAASIPKVCTMLPRYSRLPQFRREHGPRAHRQLALRRTPAA